MHPASRKGPLFYKNTPPHFPLFDKSTLPFHFLPTGLYFNSQYGSYIIFFKYNFVIIFKPYASYAMLVLQFFR